MATSNPSTAASTEIAGVITPSPYSSPVPNTPSVTSTAVAPVIFAALCPTVDPRGNTSAASARIPPSPRLSARITRNRYFTEITMTSVQNTTDAAPYAVVVSTSRSA